MPKAGYRSSTPCPVAPLAAEAARLANLMGRYDTAGLYELHEAAFHRKLALLEAARELRPQSKRGALLLVLSVLDRIDPVELLNHPDEEPDAARALRQCQDALEYVALALAGPEDAGLIELHVRSRTVLADLAAAS